MKFRKVLCAGTFDHYHIGHQFYLWQGITMAQAMVVIVARDRTVCDIKNHCAENREENRKQRIEEDFLHPSIRDTYSIAPIIRLGRSDKDFYQTIKEEDPDLIFLGYDQRFDEKKAHETFPHITFKRCGPYFPEIFKSSYFRDKG
ncbi:MAG TPA: adenylyltransferase/cytidyltransferase family protein [Candidatus Gracilibacteria bacterium]